MRFERLEITTCLRRGEIEIATVFEPDALEDYAAFEAAVVERHGDAVSVAQRAQLLERHLAEVIQTYGVWTYLILAATIFLETGVVATPFLPGDSLLFVTGTLAAAGGMDILWVSVTLIAAAICGDNTNYWIGHHLGPRVFRHRDGRFLNPRHLEKAREFYARHGGKAVMIGRFLPIIRTFVPFVAGAASMTYAMFAVYNITGAIAWVGICAGAGYLFGNIPIVKDNFSLVALGIVLVSIMPAVIEFLRHRRAGVVGGS